MLIGKVLRLVVFSAILIKSTFSPAQPAPRAFQAGQGGWQLGTLAVGNVDSDAQLEIIVPYKDTTGPRSLWFLDAFKPDGTRLKGFPYQGGEQAINTSPTLYDLDGDGRAEILFTCGNKIVALRGDGSTFWSTAISCQNYVPDAGYQAVTNGFYWSADRSWRDRLPDTSQFFSEVSSPIVADVNGDGTLAVMTGWKILPDSTSENQDFNPFIKPLFGFGDWGTVGDVWSGGVVFCNAQTGRKDFIYHIHQLVESGIGLGKPRPGGAPLVYVLNDSDSVVAFDKTKPYGLWGKGMLYKQFGKNQRLQSGSYLKGVDVYPADLDGDGQEELLVPTTQLDPLWQPSETVLDDDGAVLWRKWKERAEVSVANGWLNSACMIPVNPDHDNHIDVLSFTHSTEIAFRYWNGVELTDRPGWPKDFAPFVPTPPVVGDVDGDGQEEIVVGTYDPGAIPSNGTLYVFALDGTEKLSRPVPGGLKHIPALADADGDGALDVIYRGLDGVVHIDSYGAASNSSISWATHRGNMRRDGNSGRSLFPAGTPWITERQSGYRHTRFSWNVPTNMSPRSVQIFRAERPADPFHKLVELPPGTSSFTDTGLRDGCQYIYEVRAVYASGTVASAPFAILSLFDNNLVANGGFEENDNSHWDKWFTGSIPWEDMVGCSEMPYQGERCMEIRLAAQGDSSSIKQSNQYGIPDPAIRTAPGKLYSFGGWLRSGGISQPSEHWFEWNTTRTGDNTNDIPPAPWPVYFTPHWSIGTAPTAWTYVNRVFVMPEGFPNIELRHRYTIAAPGTGSIYLDNLFFREIPGVEDSRWNLLVPFGAQWKFSASEPDASWSLEQFDDSAWPEGQAKFGGGTGVRDIITSLPIMRPAYFFRRQFSVIDPNFEEFLLEARATDDYNGKTYPLRIFLNGHEVISSGIDAVSGDGNTTRYFDLLPFGEFIHAGLNTIAVMVQNGWASDWDNVAFDLALKGVSKPSVPGEGTARFNSIWPNADGSIRLRVAGPLGTTWQVQAADSPSPATWAEVQSVTMTAGQEDEIVDGGGIGRSHPRTSRTRFYRMVPVR